jgi:ADP-ribosylglycohydrolase
MIGAIIGDIAGSVYEFSDKKPLVKNIIDASCFFTDDSVLTLAIAYSLILMQKRGSFENSEEIYSQCLKIYGNRYKDAGYGANFNKWLNSKNPKPYRSFGNGSAMRISPIGLAFESFEQTMIQTEKATKITHNHRDGINGAKAVSGSIFLARNGENKDKIKKFVKNEIGYSLSFSLNELHEKYKYEIQCKYSVPQAIYCFLISESFEDAIRNAIYIGGDSDTIACIAGSIAEAYYSDISEELIIKAKDKLDAEMKSVIRDFYSTFNIKWW